MDIREALNHALKNAGRDAKIAGIRDLSGGCIHRVLLLTLADGSRLVAKTNHAAQIKLFEEEMHGLRALAATRTVLVPEPIRAHVHAGHAILLMAEMEPSGQAAPAAWQRFGEDLAALHHAPAGERYGFEIDNHIGSTLQPNSWRDDWVEFNAVNRLGFQLDAAGQQGLIESPECRMIQHVIDRLDKFIPRHPKPSLLHGDLWSGNALLTGNDRIAVIDPACSIGDGWADIAMMQLFGGFPEACFDAYSRNQSNRDNLAWRIAVYQLYHVLNHVNIFGRRYVAQALSLVRRLQ